MIRTARLALRRPEPEDIDTLAEIWGDPRVMNDLGPVKDRAMSEATLARHLDYWDHGYGFWLVERDGAPAGFAGLKPGAPDTPIEGEVEAGWMFAPAHWGQGLAQEAMAAALAWGWAHLAPPRIVAITAERNAASRRLMARLGMAHLPELAFEHPLFAADDPLRHTVTYAIDRPA
ncbi:GNAT family N-acetyltransferase [Sphingomonas spermidinifaciens]|uniref:GNAT family N-acetyltransferase n=1 Tax=Sphingomonas spermidinifaciens TaxID=1141889 RepID=UPI001FE3C6EF|nr:GNAT family N-acetyltransferase [Sphingomonas spermidinifaciens]